MRHATAVILLAFLFSFPRPGPGRIGATPPAPGANCVLPATIPCTIAVD